MIHPRAGSAASAVLAAVALFATSPARAQTSSPAIPDSATLHVETLPPGLEIWIDGSLAGRSPLTLSLPAGHVRIRAVSEDPSRYGTAPDRAEVLLKPGGSETVRFDLRPPAIIRSRPESATIVRLRGWAGTLDSLLGETPLTVAPSAIESDSLRLRLSGYADTTMAGLRFLATPESSEPVALRRLAVQPEPPRTPGTPLLKKRWFQWALVGVGSALCASAVVLREKGDDSYAKYLASSDRDEIPGLYDETVRYDRMAAVSLVSGQILLVGGIVLLVTGPSR